MRTLLLLSLVIIFCTSVLVLSHDVHSHDTSGCAYTHSSRNNIIDAKEILKNRAKKRAVQGAVPSKLNVVYADGVSQDFQKEFSAAAAIWETIIESSGVNVTINFATTDQLPTGVLGSTDAVEMTVFVNDVLNFLEPNLGLPPNTIQSPIAWKKPDSLFLDDFIVGTKANYKLLFGSKDLDNDFGDSDGSIVFSSTIDFDFDLTDGVEPGKRPLLNVAWHEIGHLLGFTSGVDKIEFFLVNPQLNETVVEARILDIFRVPEGGTDLSGVRSLIPGENVTFLTTDGFVGPNYSTGMQLGDGRQASHWEDNKGFGMMDPTIGSGEVTGITENDLLAFRQLGFFVNFAQKPVVFFVNVTSDIPPTSSPLDANPGSELVINGLFFYDYDLKCIFDNGQNSTAVSSHQNGQLTCVVPATVIGDISSFSVSSQGLQSDSMAFSVDETPKEVPTSEPTDAPTEPTDAPTEQTTQPPSMTVAPSSAFKTYISLSLLYTLAVVYLVI